MARVLLVVGCLVLLTCAGSAGAAGKPVPHLVRIDNSIHHGVIRSVPSLVAADTCIVRHGDSIYYLIKGWVTGQELYKGYCDPSLTCANPYPFTVTAINMPMYFFGKPTFTVSVDVESVDLTDPTCPVPGDLLAMSSDRSYSVPDSQSLWDVWVPLDTPIVVNGPFFAGFYIGTAFAASDSAGVVTDSLPVPCRTYNVWDTTIGFVDLVNNSYFDFPGRLVLYAAGIPAGSIPPPATELISPQPDDTCYARTTIWMRDLNSSQALDYAVFEYRPADGTSYTEIGRDYTPDTPLRDGSSPATTGDGLSYVFDFSGLPEGRYTIRGTVYDTLGRSDQDSVTIYAEPTPPVPQIITYADGGTFCSPLALAMVCPDDNLDFVQAYRKDALLNYSAGITLGGPPAAGTQLAGPLAAAMAVKLWYDRGYTTPMTDGSTVLPVDTLATRLAVWFKTNTFNGTYDEHLYAGLSQYLLNKGNRLRVIYRRNPSYFQIRDWAENREYAVMLGVSGAVGTWLTVDGFTGVVQSDGTWDVVVANPLSGATEQMAIRNNGGVNEISFDGSWHPIDIMVGVYAPDWTVTRQSIGVDLNPADGLTVTWTPSGVVEGEPYFIYARGYDHLGMQGFSTMLLQYRCSQTFTPGDFNNDNLVDIADASYLLNFIAQRGPLPAGGGGRADTNCDGYVNIADVVYFLNYLLGTGSAPCY